jgi:SAM-dependent methyltransferase
VIAFESSEFEEFLAWEGSERDWMAFAGTIYDTISYLDGDRPTRLFIDAADDPRYTVALARTSSLVDFAAWKITAGVSCREAGDEVRRAAHRAGLLPYIAEIAVIDQRTKLPIKDTTFDVALVIGALDQAHDANIRLKIVEELSRILKPGGYLLMSALSRSGPPLSTLLNTDADLSNESLTTVDSIFRAQPLRVPVVPTAQWPYVYFDVDELTELVRKANLTLVDVLARGGLASWVPKALWDRTRADGKETYWTLRNFILTAGDSPILLGASDEFLVVASRGHDASEHMS